MVRVCLVPESVFRRLIPSSYPDDSSSRLRWVRRHSSPKTQAVVYPYDTYDPLMGWRLTPGLKNIKPFRLFKDKVLSSNSSGIRGQTEYPEVSEAGRTRVLILGDSFTFGEGVSDDETYAHDLETLFENVTVMNLGVHGYGHDQMLLHFEKDGARYHPDLVLLGFVWDDMSRNLLGFRDYWKPRFVMRDNRLVLTNVPIPTPEQTLESEIFRLKLWDFGVIFWHGLVNLVGLRQQQAHAATTALLDELAAVCHRTGARPAVAYLPVWDELKTGNEAMLPDEQFLFQYCESRQMPCVFLRPAFLAARRTGAVLGRTYHWSPSEHWIAARALRDLLLQKGLIPTLRKRPGPAPIDAPAPASMRPMSE